MLLAPAAVLDVEAGALVPAPSTVQLAGASDMGAVLAELGRSLSLGDVKVRCTRSTVPTSWQLSPAAARCIAVRGVRS